MLAQDGSRCLIARNRALALAQVPLFKLVQRRPRPIRQIPPRKKYGPRPRRIFPAANQELGISKRTRPIFNQQHIRLQLLHVQVTGQINVAHLIARKCHARRIELPARISRALRPQLILQRLMPAVRHNGSQRHARQLRQRRKFLLVLCNHVSMASHQNLQAFHLINCRRRLVIARAHGLNASMPDSGQVGHCFHIARHKERKQILVAARRQAGEQPRPARRGQQQHNACCIN